MNRNGLSSSDLITYHIPLKTPTWLIYKRPTDKVNTSHLTNNVLNCGSGLNGMMCNHEDHFKMLWHRNIAVNKISKHKPNQKVRPQILDYRPPTVQLTHTVHTSTFYYFLRFLSFFYSYKNFFFFTLLYYLLHYFWTGRNHRGSLHCYKNKFHVGLNGMEKKHTVVCLLSSFLSGHFLAE